MKKLLKVIIFTSLLIYCSTPPDYSPDKSLDPLRKTALMDKLIRYVGKKPEKGTHQNKFSSTFDEHYNDLLVKHKLTHYYINKNGDHFFMIRRVAPSLYEKYVSTGGKFRLNESDSIIYYEEVFRTWKMQADTLQRRSTLLFDKMIKGESLEPFLTKNSRGVEFIEFPDENVYFDTTERIWKSKIFGSVEEMVDSGIN